jgi:3-carboxy-cis,cis-muconate cycloisomerase
MPQKRNPVGAALALACARQVTADAAVLTAGLVQEHERAAGAWHAEWDALSRALALTGGAARAIAELLEGLEVDAARMRANVASSTLAEAERFAPAATQPEDYLGSVGLFVDRALAFYEEDA